MCLSQKIVPQQVKRINENIEAPRLPSRLKRVQAILNLPDLLISGPDPNLQTPCRELSEACQHSSLSIEQTRHSDQRAMASESLDHDALNAACRDLDLDGGNRTAAEAGTIPSTPTLSDLDKSDVSSMFETGITIHTLGVLTAPTSVESLSGAPKNALLHELQGMHSRLLYRTAISSNPQNLRLSLAGKNQPVDIDDNIQTSSKFLRSPNPSEPCWKDTSADSESDYDPREVVAYLKMRRLERESIDDQDESQASRWSHKLGLRMGQRTADGEVAWLEKRLEFKSQAVYVPEPVSHSKRLRFCLFLMLSHRNSPITNWNGTMWRSSRTMSHND
jgi:hypothetical protein